MGFSDMITAADTAPFIPTEQTFEIIKTTKEQSVVLPHARRLPDLSRKTRTLKVEDVLASVYMVNGPSGADAPGLKQTTSSSWRDVVLTVEELAVIVTLSQEQLDDSGVPLWPEVREQIAAAFAKAMDEAMLNGTVGGVAAFSTWPSGGVRGHAVAAGNTVALGAGADIYDDLLSESGVFSLVEADGYEIDTCFGAIGIKSRLRGLRDSLGNPIFNKSAQSGMGYELDGAPCIFPKSGCFPTANTHLIVGQWDQLVWANRQDISYALATAGVITDVAGNVIVNLFQQDMVALRAVLRFGFALPNPINTVNTTTATRSPFGVLTT